MATDLRGTIHQLESLASQMLELAEEIKQQLIFSGFSPLARIDIGWDKKLGVVIRWNGQEMDAEAALHYMETQGYITPYDFSVWEN